MRTKKAYRENTQFYRTYSPLSKPHFSHGRH